MVPDVGRKRPMEATEGPAMSGIKPPELQKFYDSLSERGTSIEKLANAIKRSRPTVTRVLNGSRRRGPVWRKLTPLLTAEEIALLNVAHCSPWNTNRIAKRPTWPPAGFKPQEAA